MKKHLLASGKAGKPENRRQSASTPIQRAKRAPAAHAKLPFLQHKDPI